MTSAAVTSAPANPLGAPSTDLTTAFTSSRTIEAELAPPPAPMAMPKQIIERADAQRSAQRLRLPFFGGRVQGQP